MRSRRSSSGIVSTPPRRRSIAFAPLFDRAVVLHAKSLVIAMAVPFALLLPLVYFGSRRPFSIHAVFALHLYAFLLLIFCVALGVAAVDVMLGGTGLASAAIDNVLTGLILTGAAVYLYLSTGRVYGVAGWSRIARSPAARSGRRRDHRRLPFRNLHRHPLHHLNRVGLPPVGRACCCVQSHVKHLHAGA